MEGQRSEWTQTAISYPELTLDMNDVKAALNQLIDYSVQNDRRLTDSIDRLAQAQTSTLQIVGQLQNQVNTFKLK